MQRIFLFLILLLALTANSQKLLKGIVTDGSDQPIPGASIFLSNTSIGTSSNAKGRFQLNIPAGKFDLIISSIGYETFSKTITASELQDSITVTLKIKTQELENVVVEPYEKDGWTKWGDFFVKNFIGASEYANQCKIKNKDVIKFRNSKVSNELTAYAFEPLIIENKALGYTIRYQLEAFSYNFKTHILLYEGYPFFEPMEGKSAKENKWEKKRTDIYYGSMMHFMRSVYRNRIMEEGFEIYPLQKIPNLEKMRVKAAYQRNFNRTELPNGVLSVTVMNKDSDAYYNKIFKEPDYRDVVAKNILPGDSIAYAVDSATAGIDFENYLLVIYKNKTVPLDYRRLHPESGPTMMSQLFLQNNKPIEIGMDGHYYDPLDLLALGYWSWSEKISTMLPFDYWPKKN